MLEFVCSDTGIGIEPEFLPHIFDSFMRERDCRVDKTEGSGLGLAITKKLTELFDGSIGVKSRPGEGTTFRIQLPLKIAPASICEADCRGMKILVVDNDAFLCEYLVQTLEELGVDVSWSGSGADAVQKVIQAKQSGEAFDMILLDWKMPDMDGMETARAIRSSMEERIPILITSAYDWSDIEKEAQQAGIDGFLQKPLFKSTLCHGVLRCMGQQQFEDTRKKLYSLEGKRILITEDNPLNREIAVELLKDMGAAVETVEDGAVPIIALTAEAFAENVEMAKDAGMNSHLSKPFDVNSLNQELRKYL